MYKFIKFLWRLIPFKKTIFVFGVIVFVVPFFIPKQTVLGVPLIDIQGKVISKVKELYLKANYDESLGDVNFDKVWPILGYDLNDSKIEKVRELNSEGTVNKKEEIAASPSDLSLAANKFGLNESDLLQQIYDKKEQLKQTIGQSKGPTKLGGGIPEVSASNLIFGSGGKSGTSGSAVERYLSLSSSGKKMSEILKSKDSGVAKSTSDENVNDNSNSKAGASMVAADRTAPSNDISSIPVLRIKNDDYLKIDRFILNHLDVWELKKLPEYKDLNALSALIGVESQVLKDYFDYHIFLFSDIRVSINKNSNSPQDFINLMKKNNWRLLDVKRATGWDDLSMLHYVVQVE